MFYVVQMTVRLCRHLYLTVLEVAKTSLMLLGKMPSEPEKWYHLFLTDYFLSFPLWCVVGSKDTHVQCPSHISETLGGLQGLEYNGSRKPTQSHFRSDSTKWAVWVANSSSKEVVTSHWNSHSSRPLLWNWCKWSLDPPAPFVPNWLWNISTKALEVAQDVTRRCGTFFNEGALLEKAANRAQCNHAMYQTAKSLSTLLQVAEPCRGDRLLVVPSQAMQNWFCYLHATYFPLVMSKNPIRIFFTQQLQCIPKHSLVSSSFPAVLFPVAESVQQSRPVAKAPLSHPPFLVSGRDTDLSCLFSPQGTYLSSRE